MTKQIISRGHESGGLYILDPAVPRPNACSGITTQFETHRKLGHPSSSPIEEIVSPVFKLVVLRL